jgi:hypothetical protein
MNAVHVDDAWIQFLGMRNYQGCLDIKQGLSTANSNLGSYVRCCIQGPGLGLGALIPCGIPWPYLGN